MVRLRIFYILILMRRYFATGYATYNMLFPTIARAGCWVHVRRIFIDVALASTTKGQANYAIDLINRLFQLESKPLVDAFFQWMSEFTKFITGESY